MSEYLHNLALTLAWVAAVVGLPAPVVALGVPEGYVRPWVPVVMGVGLVLAWPYLVTVGALS